MKPGDRVQTRRGRLGTIISIDGDTAEVFFSTGEEWINVHDLEPVELSAADQLLSGNDSPSIEFGLRLQALYLRHAHQFDPWSGLTNARIEPNPHQISIAHSVVNKRQPRMILADEVGLGKTIEAALIFKELRARGLVERALVICPASLQIQWQTELRTKFNENFEVMNSAAATHFGKNGANPFKACDLVICSLPFATQDRRSEQLLEAGWDFVAFDEAHRVRRWRPSASTTKVTKAYALAEALEPLTPAMLMLTATPMQLDPYELFSLIQLVEPGLFTSPEQYENRRLDLPKLNGLIRQLMGWTHQDDEGRSQIIDDLRVLLGTDDLSPADLNNDETRSQTIESLVDQHPWAGVLVRNRKVEIGGFMGREARQYGVRMSPAERDLFDDVESYLRFSYGRAMAEKRRAIGFAMVTYHKMLASSPAAIYASLGRRLEKLREARVAGNEPVKVSANEGHLRDVGDEGDFDRLLGDFWVDEIDREIAELEGLHERLGEAEDSKAEEFLLVMDRLRNDEPETKVVVFTGYKDTQAFLVENLRRSGHRVELFHGGMGLDQKEAAIRKFRSGADILVSTEAGGEGRNLQFASVIVNYDLPWNPMKVEQRIGRLDRIGQKKKVRVLNLFRFDTVEERVHDVLNRRIRLFEESVGSLEPILGEVEAEFEQLLLISDDEGLRALDERMEQRVAEARESERLYADLALDRASFRRDRVNDLLGTAPMATQQDLRKFIESALEFQGGTLKPHTDDGGDVITLSPDLANRVGLRRDPKRGIFDHDEALEREDLEFFAMGHRTVDAIVDFVRNNDKPRATLQVLKGGPPSPELEVHYQLRSIGRHPRGEVIRHRVGPDLLVVESEVRGIPPLGQDAHISQPEWLGDAIDASGRTARERLAQFREAMESADASMREVDLERVEGIRVYRRQRFEDRISDHHHWIDRVEASGSEGERRILQARKGLLRREEERLQDVEDLAQRERTKILAQASEATLVTWSVSLVVGS